MTPVRVNSTGRFPVKDMFVQYNLLHVAVLNETAVVSNFSTYDFPLRFENTTFLLNGVQVNRTRMYTSFPNNLTASFIVEQFAAPTFKNYFGWKMDLSNLGVKVSLKFEGITQNSELSTSTVRISAIPTMTCRLHPYEDTWAAQYIATGDPSTLPLVFYPNRPFSVNVSSSPQMDPQVLYNYLQVRDKAVNVTVSHLAGMACRTANGSESYVDVGFTIAWPQANGRPGSNADAFNGAVLQMSATAPMGFVQFTLPAQVEMHRSRCSLSTDIYEYDPDISILFGVDATPPKATASSPGDLQLAQDDAAAARLAGIIVGVILGVALLSFIVVLVASPKLRKKLMPMSGFKDNQQRVRTQIAESQTRETSSSFAPPQRDTTARDSTTQNRRWTVGSTPKEEE